MGTGRKKTKTVLVELQKFNRNAPYAIPEYLNNNMNVYGNVGRGTCNKVRLD